MCLKNINVVTALILANSKMFCIALFVCFISAKWLSRLERQIERNCDTAHEDYRVFISAEPPPSPDEHVIPQGILENSIKITNEPPTGMFANLHAALNNFSQASFID